MQEVSTRNQEQFCEVRCECRPDQPQPMSAVRVLCRREDEACQRAVPDRQVGEVLGDGTNGCVGCGGESGVDYRNDPRRMEEFLAG